jgi:hypothetical protein
MGWIHLNVWFFMIRSSYRILSLILNYEGTSYVSRSSFVSQVRLAEAPKPQLPAFCSLLFASCFLLSAFCLLLSAFCSLLFASCFLFSASSKGYTNIKYFGMISRLEGLKRCLHSSQKHPIISIFRAA